MQTFYFTDPGKVRDHNEDNVIILNNTNNEFVLAVADGMGGHSAGQNFGGFDFRQAANQGQTRQRRTAQPEKSGL